MTYTLKRYQSYQDYLDNYPDGDGDYRLLSTGEIIELPSEDDDNLLWAFQLTLLIAGISGFEKRVRGNNIELQVNPVGDRRVNRKPDVLVLHPEHRRLFKENRCTAIKIGMPAPVFVAEMVSPGGPNSDNYKRDYLWKREQYEWWGIPEYWIIDRHRDQVTVLVLEDENYKETRYSADSTIKSATFPSLVVKPQDVFG